MLQEFVNAGAPQDILYKNKPHLGTDTLRDIVKQFRSTLENLGTTFMFNTTLTNLKIENRKVRAIEINENTWIDTDVCVLAIGHSARDTLEMLANKHVEITPKTYSLGVRIEHLQQWINDAQYGPNNDCVDEIGAADYKLVHHASNGKSVYSFCMCPGGYVVASSSEPNMVVTNGMSHHKRDGANANSALLVNINDDEPFILGGIKNQQHYEKQAFIIGGSNYNAPVQTVQDFINNVPTTELGIVKPSCIWSVQSVVHSICCCHVVMKTLSESIL